MVPVAMETPSDVRSQVLAAATRLFAARGFDGTTIQAIADEVGVSKPAVLHHFPSKEALHRAVLGAMLHHWQDTLPALLLKATASEDRFDAVVGEVHRFFTEAPDRARLIVREALDHPAEVRGVVERAVKPWLTAISAYIERGRESGRHYVEVDADAYVLQILVLLLASAATVNVHASALDADPERGAARCRAEIFRIAKTSLFAPVHAESPKKRTTRPQKKTRPRR